MSTLRCWWVVTSAIAGGVAARWFRLLSDVSDYTAVKMFFVIKSVIVSLCTFAMQQTGYGCVQKLLMKEWKTSVTYINRPLVVIPCAVWVVIFFFTGRTSEEAWAWWVGSSRGVWVITAGECHGHMTLWRLKHLLLAFNTGWSHNLLLRYHFDCSLIHFCDVSLLIYRMSWCPVWLSTSLTGFLLCGKIHFMLDYLSHVK